MGEAPVDIDMGTVLKVLDLYQVEDKKQVLRKIKVLSDHYIAEIHSKRQKKLHKSKGGSLSANKPR